MTEDQALAQILRLVARRGDGVTLNGSDPEVVVDAVRKALGVRESRPPKRIRQRSKKRQADVEARRSAKIAVAGERTPILDGADHSFRIFVANLACSIDLTTSPTGRDPCHLRAKRNHGDWVIDEVGVAVGNIFPARRKYHTEQHGMPIQDFQARHGVDLQSICRVVGEAYLLGLEPEELSEAARSAGGYQLVDLERWRERRDPVVRLW